MTPVTKPTFSQHPFRLGYVKILNVISLQKLRLSNSQLPVFGVNLQWRPPDIALRALIFSRFLAGFSFKDKIFFHFSKLVKVLCFSIETWICLVCDFLWMKTILTTMTKPRSSNLCKSKKTTQSQEFPTLKQLEKTMPPFIHCVWIGGFPFAPGTTHRLMQWHGTFPSRCLGWRDFGSAAESQETCSG